MSTWSTPAERRSILADHRSGIGVSELARRFEYSRSGIYNMLLTASIEQRTRKRTELLDPIGDLRARLRPDGTRRWERLDPTSGQWLPIRKRTASQNHKIHS